MTRYTPCVFVCEMTELDKEKFGQKLCFQAGC